MDVNVVIFGGIKWYPIKNQSNQLPLILSQETTQVSPINNETGNPTTKQYSITTLRLVTHRHKY